MVAADGLGSRPASHLRQRPVKDNDPLTRVQDHHPVGTGFQDGVQATLFLSQSLVQLSVVDRNGGLVGETGQDLPVVWGKGDSVGADDVKHPNQFRPDAHREGNHLAEGQTGPQGNLRQFGFQVGNVEEKRVHLVGNVHQQEGEVFLQSGRETPRGLNGKPTVRFPDGDQGRLSAQHLHSGLQHFCQDGIQVQLGRQYPADFQQVVPLANSVTGEHIRHIRPYRKSRRNRLAFKIKKGKIRAVRVHPLSIFR